MKMTEQIVNTMNQRDEELAAKRIKTAKLDAFFQNEKA